MWQSIWQVGIDIQAQQILAVAASQQSTGWSLKQWWQLPLPSGVFCKDRLQKPERLIDTLRLWQQQLPQTYRLVCALPAALALQANLVLSEEQQKTAIDSVIQQSLNTLFPLPEQELLYDYCYPEENHSSLLITIARRVVVDEWLAIFSRAQLFPTVLEIIPCVLRSLARQQQQHPLALLLSLQSSQAVVITPLVASSQFTILPLNAPLLTTSYRWCVDHCGVTPTACLISGSREHCADCLASSPLPVSWWNPFIHTTTSLPCLPDERQEFAIACGLATRLSVEDH